MGAGADEGRPKSRFHRIAAQREAARLEALRPSPMNPTPETPPPLTPPSTDEPDGGEADKSPYWVEALAQGLAVLRVFETEHGSLTLTDIAQRLGWNRARPFRYVQTLERLGYLSREEPGRRYRPTSLTMSLGYAYLSRLSLIELAQPVLNQLRTSVNASVHMGLLDGGELVYVANARIPLPTAINIHVGSRTPAFATSIGRILLAYLSPEAVDAILGTGPIPAMTPNSTSDPVAFRHLLARARQDGYVFNDQEFHLGVRSIAAPLFDAAGQVVAGINATAMTHAFTDEVVRDAVLPAVCAAASEISRGLGFVGKPTPEPA